MTLHSTYNAEDGSGKINRSSGKDFLKAIANRPKDQKWEEKLLAFNGYKDGNLGIVWTPYEFWLNGKFSHCGANLFTLAKVGNDWKILSITDSRRKKGCKQ